jgi:hypothetical protein
MGDPAMVSEHSPAGPGGDHDGWGHRGWPRSESWRDSVWMLWHNFGGQLLIIALVVLVVSAAAYALRRRPDWIVGVRGRRVALNPAATCLMLGAGAAIAVGTLTPQSGATSRGFLQLVPLHTVRGYADSPSELLIYLGGNVALFVPLGFFLYLAVRRWVVGCTAFCGLVSVAVEITQIPIWSRSTDVDDVLTNTFGGLLGVLAAWLVLPVLRRRRAAPGATAAPDEDRVPVSP